MKRSRLFLSLVLTVLLASGCTGSKTNTESLDKEFALAIGQTATVASESLDIKFVDVTEDSRCPKNVQCIQAGRVVCAMEFTLKGVTEKASLTEPALTGDTNFQIYKGYKVTFNVQPYPEAPLQIKKSDYRLNMTVSKSI